MRVKTIFNNLPSNLKNEWKSVFTNKGNEMNVLNFLNLFENMILFCGEDEELTMNIGYLCTCQIFSHIIDDDIKNLAWLFSELSLPERHSVETHSTTKKEILSLIANKKKHYTEN